MTVGQEEVVHEGTVRCVEKRLASQRAVGADDDQTHAGAEQAASRVGVTHHLPVDRITEVRVLDPYFYFDDGLTSKFDAERGVERAP